MCLSLAAHDVATLCHFEAGHCRSLQLRFQAVRFLSMPCYCLKKLCIAMQEDALPFLCWAIPLLINAVLDNAMPLQRLATPFTSNAARRNSMQFHFSARLCSSEPFRVTAVLIYSFAIHANQCHASATRGFSFAAQVQPMQCRCPADLRIATPSLRCAFHVSVKPCRRGVTRIAAMPCHGRAMPPTAISVRYSGLAFLMGGFLLTHFPRQCRNRDSGFRNIIKCFHAPSVPPAVRGHIRCSQESFVSEILEKGFIVVPVCFVFFHFRIPSICPKN